MVFAGGFTRPTSTSTRNQPRETTASKPVVPVVLLRAKCTAHDTRRSCEHKLTRNGTCIRKNRINHTRMYKVKSAKAIVVAVSILAVSASAASAKSYPMGLDETTARSSTSTYLKTVKVAGGTVISPTITACNKVTWMTWRCSWSSDFVTNAVPAIHKTCTGIAQATRSKGTLHAKAAPGRRITCKVLVKP